MKYKLFVILVFLMGCDLKFDEIEEMPTLLTKSNARQAIYVTSENKPFSYSVRYDERLIEGNYIEKLDGETSIIINPKNQGYVDTNVESGKTYTYRVVEMPSEVLVVELEITIPLDHVVEEFLLTEDVLIKADRIFFPPNQRVTTNGHKLELEASIIQFANNVIETYSIENSAETGKYGNDAGYVSVKSNSAIGSVVVLMRGQTGGAGIRPPQTSETLLTMESLLGPEIQQK